MKIGSVEINVVAGAIGIITPEKSTLFQWSPSFRRVEVTDLLDEADELLGCSKIGCRADAMIDEDYCALHLEVEIDEEADLFDTEPDPFEAHKRERERS